ncbi:MAG: HEAT repeat domain-containing protein [Thermoguttaceae bacterium]|nr:HEAT repeat domain-containing protein [Thermoguttaceae bacterium]
MKKDLVKRATIGDPATPWETLLAVGAEALRKAGTSCPKPSTEPEQILFCKPDEGEELTEEQADFLLKTWLYSVGIATGKRFPASRIRRLLKEINEWASFHSRTDEEMRRFCGNSGLFLAFLSNRECWPFYLPNRELIYDSLDFETFSRVARQDALNNPKRSWEALRALRKRDPDKGRDVFEQLWNEPENSRKKEERTRLGLVNSLEVELDDADLPFLERALRTEDEEIVRAAVGFLVQLPKSAVGRQIRALGDAILTRDGGFTPPVYSKELEKLGFPKREGVLLGVEVIGQIPLDYWEERFGIEPRKIAEKIPFSPETEPIYAGWFCSFSHFLFHNVPRFSEWGIVLTTLLIALEFDGLADRELEDFLKERAGAPCTPTDVFDGRSGRYALDAFLELKFKRLERTVKSARKREFEKFTFRVRYYPKPWSDEFCDEYYRMALENGSVPYDFKLRFAGNIGEFPRPKREKILAELRKNSDDSKRSKALISTAERNASRAEEVERIIGDYRLMD